MLQIIFILMLLPVLRFTTHASSFYSLPKPVKRRIKALKKLQLETTKIEANFFQEVHALECKYAKLYQPLYDKVSEDLLYFLLIRW